VLSLEVGTLGLEVDGLELVGDGVPGGEAVI